MSETRSWRPWASRGILLLVAALLTTVWFAGDPRRRVAHTPDVVGARPAPAVARPSLPAAAYVGDAVCARCHAEIAETYRQHPMGHSMSAAADVLPEAVGTVLRVDDLEYAIDRRDGRVFHRETRRDESGRVVESREAEVRYALGSGTRGYSFLVERGDGLYQSPLSWYAQRQRWDLAPGFRGRNEHFNRAITLLCLFCHTNRVEKAPGRAPVFHGLSIGCERCHGPGKLHARRPTAKADGQEGSGIVNPDHLVSRARREDVCAQCHFQGTDRETRPGHSPFDFRPGLSLDEFILVSSPRVFNPKFGRRSDGIFPQMWRSRCYRESDGRLGCTSCHDPHRRPAAEERVGYFRGRCLECHTDRGCSVPSAARLAQSPADNCVSCHMPRSTARQIPHTVRTNHAVPRRAGNAAR